MLTCSFSDTYSLRIVSSEITIQCLYATITSRFDYVSDSTRRRTGQLSDRSQRNGAALLIPLGRTAVIERNVRGGKQDCVSCHFFIISWHENFQSANRRGARQSREGARQRGCRKRPRRRPPDARRAHGCFGRKELVLRRAAGLARQPGDRGLVGCAAAVPRRNPRGKESSSWTKPRSRAKSESCRPRCSAGNGGAGRRAGGREGESTAHYSANAGICPRDVSTFGAERSAGPGAEWARTARFLIPRPARSRKNLGAFR